jgi:hypothetical protein
MVLVTREHRFEQPRMMTARELGGGKQKKLNLTRRRSLTVLDWFLQKKQRKYKNGSFEKTMCC